MATTSDKEDEEEEVGFNHHHLSPLPSHPFLVHFCACPDRPSPPGCHQANLTVALLSAR
jgi:hypothetical protein